MSDQHDCGQCPVALICPDNIANHGFEATDGASANLGGVSAGLIMALMLDHIERFQAKLALSDWYAWHAARCAMKSRELHDGHASFTAIGYFIQSVIEMLNVFDLATGVKILTDSDYDRLEITYRASLLVRSPEIVAANSVGILEEHIAKYAKLSAHSPMVDMDLREETAVLTMITVRALMEIGAVRDLSGELAKTSSK